MPKPRFYFGALLTWMIFSLFTACACLPLLMIGKGSIGQTHQEACGGAGIPAADRSNEIVDPYKALAKRWYENRASAKDMEYKRAAGTAIMAHGLGLFALLGGIAIDAEKWGKMTTLESASKLITFGFATMTYFIIFVLVGWGTVSDPENQELTTADHNLDGQNCDEGNTWYNNFESSLETGGLVCMGLLLILNAVLIGSAVVVQRQVSNAVKPEA